MGSALFYFLLRPIWARTLGVGDQSVYKLQNVRLVADIRQGVIVHGFGEVDAVEYLDLVPPVLEESSHLP